MADIKRIVVGPLNTNCYVVSAEGQALVIDPGGGAEEIAAALASKRLNSIVLTHFHFDHHLACLRLKQIYPQVTVNIHQEDGPYLPFPADFLLREGSRLWVGDLELSVIHTPGHSRGSICLLGKNEIFTGDTLFADGICGRTDLPGSDEADMAASLERLKKIISGSMSVYPGHGRVLEPDKQKQPG